MAQREMRFHKWYECDLCEEFHPINLNWNIKTTVHADILGPHPMMHDTVPKLLKAVITARSPDLYVDACQQVDSVLNEFKKKLTSTNASEEFRQMVFYAMHQLDGCFHVAKCIAKKTNICVREVKNRFILDSKHPKRNLNGYIQRLASYMHVQIYQAVRVFTSDPADHWLELTGFNLL